MFIKENITCNYCYFKTEQDYAHVKQINSCKYLDNFHNNNWIVKSLYLKIVKCTEYLMNEFFCL